MLDVRAPTARARRSGHVKDSWNNESDRSERKGNHRSARAGFIEELLFVFHPAHQRGDTQDEQNIADDRPGNGCFDHAGEALGKRDARDDQLRGIPEGGVQ